MGFFKDNASDLISAGSGILSTLIQNAFNVKQQQRANAHNREMVELQNAAASQESEKAYQRSTPVNQIGNMRAAGMSFAGAVNALNGGGSYQPAPVNSAQDTAPQVDLSGISNALQGFAQLKQQRELADKQLKASKEQQQVQIASDEKKHAAQLETQKEIAQLNADTTNRNADKRLDFDVERLDFDKSVHDYFKEDERKEIRARISKLESDKKMTDEQRIQLNNLYDLTRETATETVNKLKAEVETYNKTNDLNYKRYLLEKMKVTLESKLGEISYLRGTIDFWRNPEQMSLIAKGVGWQTDYSKSTAHAEEDLEKYLDEIQAIIDLLD